MTNEIKAFIVMILIEFLLLGIAILNLASNQFNMSDGIAAVFGMYFFIHTFFTVIGFPIRILGLI